MLRLISLIAICLVLACASAWAAPSISGVSGTASGGEAITISGSDFGNGPSIVIFDDFEKGTSGSAIATGSSSAQVGGWSSLGLTNPIYSTAAKVSGSLAMRSDHNSSWLSYAEVPLSGGGNRYIFASWWFYLPSGDNYPGQGSEYAINWKTVWAMGASSNDNDLALPTALGQEYGDSITGWYIAGNGSSYTRYVTGIMDFSKGEWKRVWVWVDAGTASDGAVHWFTMDPTGVRSNIDNNVQVLNGNVFQRIRFNGYGRVTSNCHPMFDDVYVAEGQYARARVEIGNNATYANCTNLTICTPTSWAGSSITATVRQGSFSAGTAYLFVVDADGVVSDGYEITLGSSAGGGGWSASGTMSIH